MHPATDAKSKRTALETIRRIENVRQLESVVTAMRGIAASRAQ